MAFIELNQTGDRIVVYSEYHEKDIIKSVPGSRWDSTNKVWTLPLSWASCVIARGVFGERLEVGQLVNEWAAQEITNRVMPSMAIRDLLDTDNNRYRSAVEALADVERDSRLYPFQRVGADFLTLSGNSLLADVMGTGKSCTTLAAMRSVHQLNSNALPAVIISPNTLKTHWHNHVAEWFPEATPYTVTGSASQRRKILAEAAQDPTAVVMINIESVRLFSRLAPYGSTHLKSCKECEPKTGNPDLTPGKCQKHPKELNTIGFKTVVIDEAHRVKNPKALQTRAIWAVCHSPSVAQRWALTGTPIANHPGDLWALMHAVSPLEYPTKTKFVERYAQTEFNAFGGLQILGLRHDTKEELFKFFDPRFRRITKEQVLKDLPPKSRVLHTVEMTPKQKKAYDELEAGMVTRLEDGSVIVASTHLAAQTRLLQLASSYCEIDKGDTPEDFGSWKVTLTDPSPKVDALIEILDDMGARDWDGTGIAVVVAAQHRQLLELAAKRLTKEGIPYVVVTGEVKDIVRAANVDDFQAGKVPVLLMTYAAGGVGLTMTRAKVMVRLQRSWSLIDNRQGEDRVHRIGSEVHDSVTIIDVVTSGTVEVDQQRRLALKLQRLEEIMRDRKRLTDSGLSTDTLDLEEASLTGSYLGE